MLIFAHSCRAAQRAETAGRQNHNPVVTLRSVEFRARWLGKLVTALQLLTLVAVLIATPAVPMLVIVVGAASAASIADYTLTLWRERTT